MRNSPALVMLGKIHKPTEMKIYKETRVKWETVLVIKGPALFTMMMLKLVVVMLGKIHKPTEMKIYKETRVKWETVLVIKGPALWNKNI